MSPTQHRAAAPAPKVDRDEVRRLASDGAQVVEVLERRQFEEAHLPGAIHIHLPDIDDDAPGALARDRPVIVYCNDFL